MILSNPPNLKDTFLDKAGCEISVLDTYEAALNSYSIDRIERACDEILKSQTWFPKPATIIEYYNGLPHEPVLALPEPELTADDVRRNRLAKIFYLAWFFMEDGPDKQKAMIQAQDPAAFDEFVAKHWDDDLDELEREMLPKRKRQPKSEFRSIGTIIAGDQMKRLRLTADYRDELEETGREYNSDERQKYIEDHWNKEVRDEG